MKPYLILILTAAPLLGACAREAQHPLTGNAAIAAQPTAAWTSPGGPGADWIDGLISAKVAGSLYRHGAFFPHDPPGGDSAGALP